MRRVDVSRRDTVDTGNPGRSHAELVVLRPAMECLVADARRAAPEECCGLLLGKDRCVRWARPTGNVAENRGRRFEIDPQALVDAYREERRGGPQVLGCYHSHPSGDAQPSATDRALAPHDGRIWGIVGEEGVTFWRDGENGFESLSYTIADG